MLCLNYGLSLLQLQRAAMDAGMALDFHLRRGDSLITRARNDCVASFLANPRFTHLFFIDSDIGFAPEAAFRLLLADRDVAAGVYPLKREDWPPGGVPQGTTRAEFEARYARYTVNTGRPGETGVDLVIDGDGFMQVREAPTGFMCLKRQVFDRLIAAYPELRYVPDWPKGTYPEGGVHFRFFDVMVDPEFGPVSLRGLRLLPAVGADRRRGLHRRHLQPYPPGRTALYRRLRHHPQDGAARSRRRAGRPAHEHLRARQPEAEALTPGLSGDVTMRACLET